MLYKDGSQFVIDGIKCDYKVFDFDAVDDAKSDGWKTHEEFFNPSEEEKKQRGRPRKAVSDANEKEPD